MSRRPNILLITLDQWRGDCVGALGHPCLRTPHIDALARDGALFERHYTVASPCGPARASLLTGLYLHHHRSFRNGIAVAAGCTNVALELRKAGYEPTLFGFTDTTSREDAATAAAKREPAPISMAPGFREGLHLPGDAWTWVEWLEQRGYQRPDHPRDMWLPAARRSAIDATPPVYGADESETSFLTRHVIEFISGRKEPWFAHVSYFRPHHRYIAPEPYNRLYAPAMAPPPVRRESRSVEGQQHPWLKALLARQLEGQAPVRDALPMACADPLDAVRQLRALYYGSINECDDAVGQLVKELKWTAQYDDTLIILTADHGDMLGDHWLWAAEGYFDAAFHVPLIIKMPNSTPGSGTRVRSFTESVDVFPTVLDVAGVNAPRNDGLPLSRLASGEIAQAHRSRVHWEFDFRDIPTPSLQAQLGLETDIAHLTVHRSERFKYVEFAGLKPLLFDLEQDPGEFNNIASDPGAQELLLHFVETMRGWRH